jgi:hypothetical protein
MGFRDFAANRSFSENSLWQTHEKQGLARHMVDDLHSFIGSSSNEHRRCLTKTCRIKLDPSETKKTARSFRIGHPTDLLTPRGLGLRFRSPS